MEGRKGRIRDPKPLPSGLCGPVPSVVGLRLAPWPSVPRGLWLAPMPRWGRGSRKPIDVVALKRGASEALTCHRGCCLGRWMWERRQQASTTNSPATGCVWPACVDQLARHLRAVRGSTVRSTGHSSGDLLYAEWVTVNGTAMRRVVDSRDLRQWRSGLLFDRGTYPYCRWSPGGRRSQSRMVQVELPSRAQCPTARASWSRAATAQKRLSLPHATASSQGVARRDGGALTFRVRRVPQPACRSHG